MATFRQDPLLATARGFLTLLIVLMLVIIAGLAVGIPAILIYGGTFLAELAKEYGPDAGSPQLLWAFVSIMAICIAIVAMGWKFLVLLRRIVDTVALGDPFVPENADRLRLMGWLSLAAQVVGIPAALIGAWVSTVLEGTDIDFGVSLGGLLLAMTLFILARVFRQGAAMRADLEGTV